jgi:PDZ domain-containing protein
VTDTNDNPPLVAEEQGKQLSRGTGIWIVALFLGIALGAGMGLVHLPYAILQPGPISNTLGNGSNGKPLITIAGRPTYPATGALNFVTVAVLGGPTNPVNGWEWLSGHLDSTNAVVPEDEIFPTGATSTEVDQTDAAEMAGSQQEAIAVALRAVGETVPEIVTVEALTTGSPSRGVLLPGDVLLSVDGKTISSAEALQTAIRAHKPGEKVVFTIRRGGKEQVATVKTGSAGGNAIVGVYLGSQFVFPTKVSINAGDVGGPSAGMMFSLAVYDKLTPGSLTGGADIAGTGTIDSTGAVGAIGGIQQKMVGAQRGGATWFLAPDSDCNEVVGHVPAGLKVVKVSTFTQALDAVKAIAARRGSSLPTCP